jgi:hypothetical protein
MLSFTPSLSRSPFCAVSAFPSYVILIVSGTKEHLAKKKTLWQYAKDKDEVLYKKLRHSLLGWSVNIPTSAGRWISKQGYKIANNIIGFN